MTTLRLISLWYAKAADGTIHRRVEVRAAGDRCRVYFDEGVMASGDFYTGRTRIESWPSDPTVVSDSLRQLGYEPAA